MNVTQAFFPVINKFLSDSLREFLEQNPDLSIEAKKSLLAFGAHVGKSLTVQEDV